MYKGLSLAPNTTTGCELSSNSYILPPYKGRRPRRLSPSNLEDRSPVSGKSPLPFQVGLTASYT
jgi:hypothetical protein